MCLYVCIRIYILSLKLRFLTSAKIGFLTQHQVEGWAEEKRREEEKTLGNVSAAKTIQSWTYILKKMVVPLSFSKAVPMPNCQILLVNLGSSAIGFFCDIKEKLQEIKNGSW